jgi:hypothetical protein
MQFVSLRMIVKCVGFNKIDNIDDLGWRRRDLHALGCQEC